MSSKPTLDVSRRACLALLGGAAVSPAMLVLAPAPVAALTKQESKFDAAELSWREYRRDDIGFRVEVPGEPKTDESPDNPGFTGVVVSFDRVTFGVTVMDFGEDHVLPGGLILYGHAKLQQFSFGIKPKSSRFTMNGTPGREDIFESKDKIMHFRSVFHSGRIIQAYVEWCLPDDIKPAAQRYLQSFALLPVSR